jgi:hypothetical protein
MAFDIFDYAPAFVVIVGKVRNICAKLGSVEDAGKTGLLLKVADLANAL